MDNLGRSGDGGARFSSSWSSFQFCLSEHCFQETQSSLLYLPISTFPMTPKGQGELGRGDLLGKEAVLWPKL